MRVMKGVGFGGVWFRTYLIYILPYSWWCFRLPWLEVLVLVDFCDFVMFVIISRPPFRFENSPSCGNWKRLLAVDNNDISHWFG